MLEKRPDTAILIFTRSEEEEARVKPFAGCNRKSANQSLARALNRQVTKVAAKTGLPIVVFRGPKQRGETFGERFAHAIQDAYRLGFEKIIAIGNDCPGLSPTLLTHAANELESNHFVFGPATDGGVYLIGMHRSGFDVEKFTALPWQTGQVLTALLDYACQSTVSLLPISADADDGASLAAALGSMNCFWALRNTLENLLLLPSPLLFFEKKYPPAPIISHHFSLRGPPHP